MLCTMAGYPSQSGLVPNLSVISHSLCISISFIKTKQNRARALSYDGFPRGLKSKFLCIPNQDFEKYQQCILSFDQIRICIKVLIKYRSVLSLEVALKVWDISAPDSIPSIKFSNKKCSWMLLCQKFDISVNLHFGAN